MWDSIGTFIWTSRRTVRNIPLIPPSTMHGVSLHIKVNTHLNINSLFPFQTTITFFISTSIISRRSLITLLQMSALEQVNLRANKRCQLPTIPAPQYKWMSVLTYLSQTLIKNIFQNFLILDSVNSYPLSQKPSNISRTIA